MSRAKTKEAKEDDASKQEQKFEVSDYVLEWKVIEHDKLKIDTARTHGQVCLSLLSMHVLHNACPVGWY
jgi:hypothetical protein